MIPFNLPFSCLYRPAYFLKLSPFKFANWYFLVNHLLLYFCIYSWFQISLCCYKDRIREVNGLCLLTFVSYFRVRIYGILILMELDHFSLLVEITWLIKLEYVTVVWLEHLSIRLIPWSTYLSSRRFLPFSASLQLVEGCWGECAAVVEELGAGELVSWWTIDVYIFEFIYYL